jgi:EAL domain-containing protein (putative c-di-GMP-specific phosphodiesterase class I)
MQTRAETELVPTFGKRKVAPRACVADGKRHIRNFLREALEDLDFICSECQDAGAIAAIVTELQPDLFIIGLSGGGLAANVILEELHRLRFPGCVLIFGADVYPMTTALQRVGEELGLAMLPLLSTPFNDQDLKQRTAALRRHEPPPNPPVDVAAALHADWLDLWYQPKIELRSMSVHGAEALVRLRHPTWGIVPPAHFLPDAADPSFRRLSEFVITRAIKDWHYFFGSHGHVALAINLPIAFLQDPAAPETLADALPRHPAFAGITVEIGAGDVVRNAEAAAAIARRLQLLNIGVSVDDVGEEWPALMAINDFPFTEIKVDRRFVSGCGDDRLKQWNCRQVVDIAARFGARTVAVGVETRADFIMAREIGFDIIQGFFFAKPMEPRRFAPRVLGRQIEVPK